VNDLDIKTLINSAVDAELAGHRVAPPIDLAAFADRRGPARAVRLWSAPLLAASVAVLLAVGAMLAITLNREQRSNQVGNSASPVPSASPSLSLSLSTNPDQEAADREYAEAVAGAREATEVAGVTVEPLSAQETAQLKDSSTIRADADIMAPEPGKTYSFTMSYLAGPSNKPPAVVTIEVQDIASGSCPQPFLARPGHAYRIRCQVVLLAAPTGQATLMARSPGSAASGVIDLIDPAKGYAAAVADAPEASTVAGVSDRPATAAERRRSVESLGLLEGPIAAPEQGRSYPMTFLYVPASNAPAISVLAFTLEDVTAGRCPRPFRIRPAHAYSIRCQVTFKVDPVGFIGLANYLVTSPKGVEKTGIYLSSP
jgi:hypothetical protein